MMMPHKAADTPMMIRSDCQRGALSVVAIGRPTHDWPRHGLVVAAVAGRAGETDSSAVGMVRGTARLALEASRDGTGIPGAVGVAMAVGHEHPTPAGSESHEQKTSGDDERFHLTLMTFPSFIST